MEMEVSAESHVGLKTSEVEKGDTHFGLGAPVEKAPVEQDSKVDLSSEDIIQFGDMNFMNGELACMEWVLSMKRDQLAFKTRKMVQDRYLKMKSVAERMRREVMKKAMPEMMNKQVENGESDKAI